MGIVVHAVIGDEPHDGTELDKATHPNVDRAMKSIGQGIACWVRMLDIIRERQVEEGRLAALEQCDPGIEHEQ